MCPGHCVACHGRIFPCPGHGVIYQGQSTFCHVNGHGDYWGSFISGGVFSFGSEAGVGLGP